ncbi:putative esterase [Blastococcus colisei]|uniref:Putative esterase n=1 Tax=Blastococcus colisei TaxID=1564162 RepID=A0A543PFE1_9ACTN|nr:GDSL-type esterase/lipase family protein [Blastococcus colisei]TQN42792.1 putative esterase [Blastococcus colisei]
MAEPGVPAYVALGDSISIDDYAGGPGRGAASLLFTNRDEDFPEWRGHDLRTVTPGTTSSLSATDGATTRTLLQAQLPRLRALGERPTLVTLTIGGNDLLGAYGDTGAARAAVIGGVRAAVDTALAELRDVCAPAARIVVGTVYDPSDGTGDAARLGLPSWPDAVPVIAELNDTLRAVAGPHGAVVAEIAAVFSGHGLRAGDPTGATRDRRSGTCGSATSSSRMPGAPAVSVPPSGRPSATAEGDRATVPRARSTWTRRRVLAVGGRLALGALLAGCTARDQEEPMSGDRSAQLTARPPENAPEPPREPVEPGDHPLGLVADRDPVLHVPPGFDPAAAAPLVVSLHGAGGSAAGGLALLSALADEHGLLVLAPASRGSTWDAIRGRYGADRALVDQALETVFTTVRVDPERIAVAGFSDGASYALGLGLANGVLFRRIVAFSPGFVPSASRQGRPDVYVSHGDADDVLPVGRTSRRIVPALEEDGYDVIYREFAGGHTVPPGIAREAVEWLDRGGAG